MSDRWVVVLLDGKPKPGVHAAWIIDGEELAEAFRAYVSDEVDPAVKVRAMDPVGELLHWRDQVGLPAQTRVPLPPGEIALLTAELCQSQPTEIAADLGVKLALALDDWLAGEATGAPAGVVHAAGCDSADCQGACDG